MTEGPLEVVEEQVPERPTWRDRVAPKGVDWRSLVLIPTLAVLSALIVGAVFIVLTEGLDAILPAYKALFTGAFVGWGSISETLLVATPLTLAGLSVALGFRAGLFNIGAEGQMTIGGLTAVIVGFSFEGLPAVAHVPLAVLAGLLGGALWGFIPGVLRAKTGAHEVITTIMLNFIAFRTLDYVLKLPGIQQPDRFDPISKPVVAGARLPKILGWLPIDNAGGLRVHLGFLIALLMAWVVYWLLFKSTIGFEFRAVGANPSAAKYGGMSVVGATILVMAMAGGLAGMAGANETLGVLGRASPGFTAQIGFDAIALALLGRSHPGGVVLSAILFGALRSGGRTMQVQSDVGIDLIVIIQALIIVFIAAPELVRAIYRVKGGKETGQLTRGWST
ncbi:MAG TPA: ABC transporter permease [Acidimicrobiia bacterium]|nr:ABC transporter permease [Acidimicrobiia bacterium]